MLDFITVAAFLPFEPKLVDWPIGDQLVILFSFRFLLAHFGLPMVRYSSASVGLSDRQAFQRASPPKPLGISKPDFMCRWTKVYSRHLGHMAKMVATPIFIIGKNSFRNFLRLNQRTHLHKASYVASWTQVNHSLLKWWPWADLCLLCGKVKFCLFIGWKCLKLLKSLAWKLVDWVKVWVLKAKVIKLFSKTIVPL